ncbi:hypothetical protein [Bradyrhizobium sp. BWA-3-5]|jgi:hypothetical protein|uniref:hypothetical protein n=1 Tax=Bradyrhizobium sp. BWA-3-5 TaxID=3080013 RepID=UPI00293EFFC3|nr:hypothetical protein [Bradyrhizobium sp. BWA-3-5]WOH62898.1 hypothetical protein RX331_19305 [Bradyrhizobium sp. BWA-3-5]
MGIKAGHIAALVAAGILAWFPAREAWAANGAYAVDAADIGEAGSCKIESWLSAASNTDFSAVANPSCVVNPFKPVELSMLTNRARSEGEWSMTFQPKAKMNIAPTGVGRLGYSFYAGGSFDALTGDNLTAFAVVPATFRLSENTRLNFNGGWLWDRSIDRHYLLYGIGFDWKFTDTLQWTIEAFGQAGRSDTPSVVQPRFQTGMRYRPNEIFSVDLIYGRNIAGENANWITLGTTIRFPVPGGKPDHHRTGHL